MGYQARRRHIVVGGAGGVTGEGNGSSATTLTRSSTAPESSDTTNGAAAATITASPKTNSSARPGDRPGEAAQGVAVEDLRCRDAEDVRQREYERDQGTRSPHRSPDGGRTQAADARCRDVRSRGRHECHGGDQCAYGGQRTRSNTNLAMGSAHGVNGPALGSPGMASGSGRCLPTGPAGGLRPGRDRQCEHGAGWERRRWNLDWRLD